MKQKLLEMIQVTVWLLNYEYMFVWSYKNGNGRQNRSNFNGQAPQLSARVTLVPTGAGMVCHMVSKLTRPGHLLSKEGREGEDE